MSIGPFIFFFYNYVLKKIFSKINSKTSQFLFWTYLRYFLISVFETYLSLKSKNRFPDLQCAVLTNSLPKSSTSSITSNIFSSTNIGYIIYPIQTAFFIIYCLALTSFTKVKTEIIIINIICLVRIAEDEYPWACCQDTSQGWHEKREDSRRGVERSPGELHQPPVKLCYN